MDNSGSLSVQSRHRSEQPCKICTAAASHGSLTASRLSLLALEQRISSAPVRKGRIAPA